MRALLSIVTLIVLAGCGEEPVEFTEVKRLDEKITETELRTYLRVVEALPGRALPRFPRIFAPPPAWHHERTLPVSDLVTEEVGLLGERWEPKWLVRQIEHVRPLQRALRRERMTLEQFAGLTLALGLASSRSMLRENQGLKTIIERGETPIERLRRDDRPFSSISEDGMFDVLHPATWLTRTDRATRLQRVPPENVALVAKHQEKLRKILPEEFTTNPLDPIADRLDEFGLPFAEPGGLSDEGLRWDPARAIIGTDPPDPSRARVPSAARPRTLR